MVTAEGQQSREGARDRVIRAAAALLAREGPEAVSTRAVAAAAGIQPPTIFRLFGDKDGLMEAVAAFGLSKYLPAKKLLEATDDPLADLTRAWDLHVEFGLRQPVFYALAFGQSRPGHVTAAGREAVAGLQQIMKRAADAGLLRMSVERATALMHANGTGVVFSMLGTPPEERDPGLSAAARDNVLAAITGGVRHAERPASGIGHRATALRESLQGSGASVLSDGERILLTEWLNRLADADTG
ncbi:TetR/AcrR family transcriptional regulator [Streptomyces sp. NBC_01341]|uniref:TetR/AcrR family transcriptional regulator n=1 Tax=Streptomyces sp. NBC_01341 TaxID=2903831 RepID=UPI002E1033EF|nr:TetR/AcrR family transcriptional regulator [Streptomyces sp. NBC_01341]